MEELDEKIGLGLLPLPKDKRYFKITKLLGSIDLNEIPEDFIVAEPKVKNQGTTKWCTAYAISSASEVQEEVELSPVYQAAKIAQIRGEDRLNGATLKDAAKSVIKFGSLEENDVILGTGDNPASWPKECDGKAEKHRKDSYFVADGYGDTFEAVIAALWQNRTKKCLVSSGADWRPEWTIAEKGIIPEKYGNVRYPHAFLIIGWRGDYLVCHLSNGDMAGDNGRFYMSRSVANKELKYGNLLLVDIDPEEAKKIVWPWWRRFWERFKNFIKEPFK